MKFSLVTILATLAIVASATDLFYSAELDQTCEVDDDGEARNCVKGKIDGAIDFDDVPDVIVGRSLPRDTAVAPFGITCLGFWGPLKCRAKCFALHGEPCGGRCSDGWCYCSAQC